MNTCAKHTPRNFKQIAKLAIGKFQLTQWQRKINRIHANTHSPASGKFASGMRAGALIYDTTNLGDDIQTIAQLAHLPQLQSGILPLHREYLNDRSYPRNILLMMNGWFTHIGANWPPSENILPIFVGFHISNPELVNDKHVEYYRQFQPIGCRDTETVKKLEKIGVNAYFSGCPTLTLIRPEVERTDELLVVDAHLKSADRHIPDGTDLLRSLVPSSILEKASYVTHRTLDIHDNWHGFRLKKAASLLERYARAKLVITSRLHCALPCLAFGTPCVFIHKALHTDTRIKDYAALLQGYSNVTEKVNINWEKPEAANVDSQKALLKQYIEDSFKRYQQE